MMTFDSKTPLYSALIAATEAHNTRMHMPGHKGKPPEGFSGDIFSLDYTEIPGTGNLYEGVPPISCAEALMADAMSARECFFLTGGSTQGIMASMAVTCPPGSKVIVDRGCHRAVWNAMVHLDLHPVYLIPDVIAPWNISAAISPNHVEQVLKATPDVSAIVLTSPTYYGILLDIAAISRVTAKYGVPLIIDEAHGAHLPFLPGYRGAVSQGATLSIASAHKTLPALTPGAFICSDGSFDSREIRLRASMFGTSSPSYTVMASMDYARAYMQDKGGSRYLEVVSAVNRIKSELTAQGIFCVLEEGPSIHLDPARLAVNTAVAGITGHDAAAILAKRHKIVCEMSDARNIVMILTSSDSDEDLLHLQNALLNIGSQAPRIAIDSCKQLSIDPVRVMSPREVAYAPKIYVKPADAIGKVAGVHIAPYPPGIPTVAAGELIQSLEQFTDSGLTDVQIVFAT